MEFLDAKCTLKGVVTVGIGVRDPREAVESEWKTSMPGNSENSHKISENSNKLISIPLG